jgi:uncharacterized RDD family membrane protein YckC
MFLDVRGGWTLGLLVLLALVVGATNGLMTWLSGGATVGKAWAGLQVRHLHEQPIQPVLTEMPKVITRYTVGYFAIDVLLIGTLNALRDPRRRPLHDLVLAYEVVALPGAAPTRERLRTFGADLNAGRQLIIERWGWVGFLVALYVGAVSNIAIGMVWLAEHLGLSAKSGDSAATSSISATPATTPTAATTVTITIAGTAMTVAVVASGIALTPHSTTHLNEPALVPTNSVELARGDLSTPRILAGPQGDVYVTWLDVDTQQIRTRTGHAGRWSDPLVLAAPVGHAAQLQTGPSSSPCATWTEGDDVRLRCLAGERWTAGRTIGRGGLGGTVTGFDRHGRPLVLSVGPSCCVALRGHALSADPRDTAIAANLATDSEGRLHVVFSQKHHSATDSPDGVIHRISADDGRTWSPQRILDPDWTRTTAEMTPDTQGRLHLIGSSGTYRRWSPHSGWSERVQVDRDQRLIDPRMAIDPDDRAVVVFPSVDGVYLARQGDGLAFESARVLPVTRGSPFTEVDIAIGQDGRIHIVALRPGQRDRLEYYVALR